MDKRSNGKIIGTLFDSDKTYYQPDLTKMKIEDFDLYASTFFTFVNSIWIDPIIDLNRIERKFRICIPRYTEDWVGSNVIFNPNTGNLYSFEYFQIALSFVFGLYGEYESRNVQASFSKAFKDEALPLTSLLNDLNQAIDELVKQTHKTYEINRSFDGLKYVNEIEILRGVRELLYDCKKRDNVLFEDYRAFWNVATDGFLTTFRGGI